MASPIRLLYVDDEPGLLEIGKLFLELNGDFSVTTIDSASDALALLKIEGFDAIVSDYQMPKIDGITFLKQLKASGNTTPFIIFTGRGREEVVIEALNNGADYYLQKGGEPKSQFTELAHKIHQAVEQRRAVASIRDLERREADIINFLPDATFAIDTQGVVIAWNRAMEMMTGITSDHILGKGNYEYSIPFYHERRPILIDLVLKDDPVTTKKYPAITRNGTNLFSEITISHFNNGRGAALWFTASPLYNTQGTIVGAIESIREITERKRIKDALRESEKRYRNVVEDQTEFISRFLPDGTHIFVNDAYCRYFNKNPDEILGRRFYPDITPEDKDRVRHFFASLTPEHPVDTIDQRIIMQDGSIRWQRWNDRAIFDPSGTVTEYQSVGRDITDTKEAEIALQESEEKYRNIFMNSIEGLFRSTPDGRFISANPATARMLGYDSPEELISSVKDIGVQIFVDPDDRVSVINQLREEGVLKNYEVKCRHKNGTIIWGLLNIHVVRNGQGNIIFFEGSCQDITERKRAENALCESEERYRTLAETSNDLIFVIGKDDRVEYVNSSASAMLNKPSEQILGNPRSALFPPEVARHQKKALETVFENGVPARSDGGITFNDQTHWFDHVLMPLKGPDGQVRAVLGISRDITERKQAEEALHQANKKLNLLSGITRHDIKNQILTLNGFLALLKKKIPDPDSEHYFTRITEASTQISSMIQLTKEYEKIGVGAPVWHDCRTLIDATAKEIPLQKIIVKNDIPAGTEVYVDPLITKVCYNLIDNAVRHGGKITTIRFSFEERAGNLIIVCEDDGDGISADEKERIFNRGFGKNTGMGLYLAHEILSITGITITENGEPGKGARFEIIIPKGAFRRHGM
jgi:PAS domain S-box-containing protein